jgi:hypothetical protein
LLANGLPGFSDVERQKTISMEARLRLNHDLVGLDSGLDVVSCTVSGSPDYAMAGDILREDLGMSVGPGTKVDLTPFRLGSSYDPPPIPMEGWLMDL